MNSFSLKLEEGNGEGVPDRYTEILERYLRGDGAEKLALFMSYRDLRKLFTVMERGE